MFPNELIWIYNSIMRDIAVRYPKYLLFRLTGFPRTMPMNLALSVTHRCNSRCSTCRVTKRKPDELSAKEYGRIFESLNGAPRWITITGGEPFMRADLDEICSSVITAAGLDAVTIATNAFYTDRVESFARSVIRKHPDTQFIINISVDGIGPAHDKIRGLRQSFDHALETFENLNDMDLKNLKTGFHTTISRFNVNAVPDLIEYLKAFEPDHHHFEIAQTRAELNIDEHDVAPTLEDYEKVVARILNMPQRPAETLLDETISSFRKEYYRLSLEILKKKEQVIPCYAGIASAHIAPNGEVWPCCVTAHSMGNLRDKNYDFRKVWESSRAGKARDFIRENRCFCPMANAAYTNLLLHAGSIAKMAGRYLVKY
jgi:MoaA/NifB/PqqE/SkfB family radical SAM enzyme